MDISKVVIQTMSLEKLRPADYNPRKDLTKEDKEYQKLEQSLNSFGNVQPIVYNERTGNVVSGHQKLKILQEKGFKETDCVIVNLNEEEEKALNIALNKISGEWDYQKLEILFNELANSELGISITGFDENEINKIIKETEETMTENEEVDLSEFSDEKFQCKCPKCRIYV